MSPFGLLRLLPPLHLRMKLLAPHLAIRQFRAILDTPSTQISIIPHFLLG